METSPSSEASDSNEIPITAFRLSTRENVSNHRVASDPQVSNSDHPPQEGVNSHNNSQLLLPVTEPVLDETGSVGPPKQGSAPADGAQAQPILVSEPVGVGVNNSNLSSVDHAPLGHQNQSESEIIPDQLLPEPRQEGFTEQSSFVSEIPENSLAEGSADGSLSFMQNYCKKHNSEHDLVCQECRIRICSQCLFSIHKGHSVQHVKQVMSELDTIVKNCEKSGRRVEEFVQNIQDILHEEGQKEEEKNQELKEDIAKWYIDNFKAVFDQALAKEKLLKMATQSRIMTLQQSEINEDFITALFDKIKPSTLEKYSQGLKPWKLGFTRIRNQDCINDYDSLLFLTRGSNNELCISLSAQPKTAHIDNRKLCRFEDVERVTLNIVEHIPSQDAVIYSFTGLALSYMLSKLRKMSYCRIEFEHSDECYEIIINMIRNCFMKKKQVQVDWVAINPNKAYSDKDRSMKMLGGKKKNRNTRNEKVIQVDIFENMIKSYKLDFRFVSITDKNLIEILGIAQFQNLQHLSINLSKAKTSNEIIQEFAKDILPTLKSLESFELDLSFTGLTNQSIAGLLSVPLENLKRIQLILEGTNIDDISINNFANGMLSSARSLEYFDLDLSATQVTNVSNLLRTQAEGLKHFGLNLSKTRITDENVQEFVTILSSRTKLESLELDLSYTTITDQSLQQMSGVHLESLQEVRLGLSGTKVSDKIIGVLAKGVLSSLRFLESFELNLSNTAITDQSIVDLLEIDLNALKNLDLNLAKTQITDKGIQIFADRMSKSMKFLEELELDISETKVTDKSARQLKLEKPDISHTEVTDKSVTKFLQITLSKLKLFHFNLFGTEIDELKIHVVLQEISTNRLPYFELNHVKSLKQQDFNSLKLKVLETKNADSMEKLNYFELILPKSRVGFVSIPYFARKMLHSADNLEHFEANFIDTQIEDHIAHILSLSFKSIKDFKVDLSGIKLSDNILENFARGMLSSMKSTLKHFELNLSCASVTDDGIAQILAVPFEKAETFSLNLWGTKIGDKSVQSFAKGMLPSMKELKEFMLDLTGSTVTDNSIAQMLSMPLDTLSHFSLVLRYTKTSDLSIKNLVERMLPSMKKLEHFVLNLLSTSVTDQGANQLVAMPKESLKFVNVDLSRTVVSRSYVETLAHQDKNL